MLLGLGGVDDLIGDAGADEIDSADANQELVDCGGAQRSGFPRRDRPGGGMRARTLIFAIALASVLAGTATARSGSGFLLRPVKAFAFRAPRSLGLS